jgi:PucR C-terminal helix-turn-helix domain/GGDEF-like domain
VSPLREETTAAPAAVRAERTRLLRELIDQLDELAVEALDALRREMPAYAGQSEAFLRDVRDQIRRNYQANLHVFMEDREVTLEDIAFVRRAALRRARVGFALADYLNAYRVGRQVLWDAIVRCAGESPAGHEAALGLAAPVMRYADFASTHAAHAYLEYQQHVVADADRERRDLLEHLLAGEMPPPGPLHAAAESYGIRDDAPLMVAAAVPVGATEAGDVARTASAALARPAPRSLKTLVVVRQAEIVAVPAVAAGSDPGSVCTHLDSIQQALARDGMLLAVGVSTPARDVSELPRAYAEARGALECVAEGGGVAALPRLSPFEYLARRADPTARRLVDARLDAFLGDDRERGGVLIATIRAFADADLNLRVTAEKLQVHPNTVQYRLGRVEERTGRNPRHIADLRDMLVAIALDSS